MSAETHNTSTPQLGRRTIGALIGLSAGFWIFMGVQAAEQPADASQLTPRQSNIPAITEIPPTEQQFISEDGRQFLLSLGAGALIGACAGGVAEYLNHKEQTAPESGLREQASQ